MGPVTTNPVLRRLLSDPSTAAAVDVLSDRLSSQDLVSVLLHVAELRADRVDGAEVMRRYGVDRFVVPASIDGRSLAAAAVQLMDGAGAGYDPVEPSTLVPAGTHRALAGVSQNRVVTTTRRSEVMADPTVSLTLELASRRRRLLADDPRSHQPVRVCGVGRAVRAQSFSGPLSFAHFGLFSLVVGGRDVGGRRFDIDATVEVLTRLLDGAEAVSGRRSQATVTDMSGRGAGVDEIIDRVGRHRCVHDPDRTQGASYYRSYCFKISIEGDDGRVEVGDGGGVDWTQTLLGNRKERLITGALSTERLLAMRREEHD